jgi:hypothetical protein
MIFSFIGDWPDWEIISPFEEKWEARTGMGINFTGSHEK